MPVFSQAWQWTTFNRKPTMPLSVWVPLALVASLVLIGFLFVHKLSRRIKQLRADLSREIARGLKAKGAEFSLLSQQTEKVVEELRTVSEELKQLAASNREVQGHLAAASARLPHEPPLLRQMSYLFGQNEIHAVVTFPKTGGTTLVATLAELFPEKFIPSAPFHTHLLVPSSQTLTSFFDDILAFTADTPWTAHDDLFPTGWDKKLEVGHAHRLLLKERGCVPLDKSQLNCRNVRRGRPERVINYLLTTRDPVAACVSFLFQFVSTWTRWGNLSDEALLRYLQSPTSPTLIPSAPGCPWPLVQETWWHEQIEQVFGLDFLSLDFDRDRGWHVYDFGRVRFLVVRLENFDRLPEALSTFYDLPLQRIHVLDSNIGEAKAESGERYRKFRARAKIPTELLDLAYGSRFAKHFYSDTELEGFRRRWSEPAS